MDSIDALDTACTYCRLRLAAVRASDFSLPTPCTEWTVRDLLNHLLGGQRRHLMLLNGASTAMAEASRHDDHLSGDPVASFDAAHAELKRAFTAPAVSFSSCARSNTPCTDGICHRPSDSMTR